MTIGLILSASLLALPPPQAEAGEAATTIATVAARDQRLARIGYRLVTANRALCRTTVPTAGWTIHALAQYHPRLRTAARALWRLDTRPAIAVVVPGGPADRAGVRAGDTLVAIDEIRLAGIVPGATADHAGVAAAVADVERALADGIALLQVDRGGTIVQLSVAAEPACAGAFELGPDDAVQARADGRYVEIGGGLMTLLADDAELAAAAAHELAHNLLCHRVRLAAQGIDPARRRQSRAARAAILATERQADLLSVTLLANAGYDPAAAARLWERLGGLRRRRSGTHPAAADRIATLRAEAQRIAALRASGRPIAPPITAAPSSTPCVSSSQRSPP